MNTIRAATSVKLNAKKGVDFQLTLKDVSNMTTISRWSPVKMGLILLSGRFTRTTEFLKPKTNCIQQAKAFKRSSKTSSLECLLRMLKCLMRPAKVAKRTSFKIHLRSSQHGQI